MPEKKKQVKKYSRTKKNFQVLRNNVLSACLALQLNKNYMCNWIGLAKKSFEQDDPLEMHRQSRRKHGIDTTGHNTSLKLIEQTHPEGLPTSPDPWVCLNKNSLKDTPHLRHSKGHKDKWTCLMQLPSGGTDTSLWIRALWKRRWKVRIAGTDHGPPPAFPLSYE